MTIARDGLPIIFGTLVPGIIILALYSSYPHWWFMLIGIVVSIFGLFCVAFFRNPKRKIPDDSSSIVSPADGKVIKILEVDDEYVGTAYRVDIFLSIFDVHLNRIPFKGRVDFVNYRPGKFISAFKDKASEDNERTDIGIESNRGKFRVAQIAGLIARRIVCRLKKNDAVNIGQLFGMIRFGSRTEITFPKTFSPVVKVGQHVKGGETIVGRIA
ncbi:MAG: phosphatidylserine decarboxylase family protein [candidate division Zixibacteria bacterium]